MRAGVGGMLAVGVGSTDLAAVMHTGKIWFKVPRSVRVELMGSFRPGTFPKDVILHLVGKLGIAGATYEAVEFGGPAVRKLSLAGRMVLANMVAEMGAKTALVDTRGLTLPEALSGREFHDHLPDAGATYRARVDLDISDLGAQVAVILAAGRPGRIRRVALISPWVIPRPRRFPPRRVSDVLQLPLVGRPLGRLAIARLRRDPERRRQAFLSALAHPERVAGDPGMAALLELASDRLAGADLRAMTDWAASAMAFDVRPLAPRVPQPALVVAGARDRVTPVEGALRLVSVLPAGRMLRLPDVGHFPHLEASAEVLPAVVRHLA